MDIGSYMRLDTKKAKALSGKADVFRAPVFQGGGFRV